MVFFYIGKIQWIWQFYVLVLEFQQIGHVRNCRFEFGSCVKDYSCSVNANYFITSGMQRYQKLLYISIPSVVHTGNFNFLVKSSGMYLTASRTPCSTYLTLGMKQNEVHSWLRFLVTERPPDSSLVDVYKSRLICSKNWWRRKWILINRNNNPRIRIFCLLFNVNRTETIIFYPL
jgi:hypothetical protein